MCLRTSEFPTEIPPYFNPQLSLYKTVTKNSSEKNAEELYKYGIHKEFNIKHHTELNAKNRMRILTKRGKSA